MKNLKNDLFKKFEQNEFKQLHFCTGGVRTGTGAAATDNTPCTLDSVDIAKTSVASAPEGSTQLDYSDWRDECGVGDSDQGSGTGTMVPVLPAL